MTYRYGGESLSGIEKLHGIHTGKTAVMCCSGTTFKKYSDSKIPSDWIRFSINETIRKTADTTDYWVVSDEPIIHEYGEFLIPKVKILAMRQAARLMKNFLANKTWTVDSMAKPEDYDNGYQFYSRGTVLIGAIEMARWMGIKRFFCFGLDCYCGQGRNDYYYDERQPKHASEFARVDRERVKDCDSNLHIFVTHKLQKMIMKLDEVKESSLWDGIYLRCVGSKNSQQRAIEKISDRDFDSVISSEATKKDEQPKKRRRGRPKKVQKRESDAEGQATSVSEPEADSSSEGSTSHSPWLARTFRNIEGGSGIVPEAGGDSSLDAD